MAQGRASSEAPPREVRHLAPREAPSQFKLTRKLVVEVLRELALRSASLERKGWRRVVPEPLSPVRGSDIGSTHTKQGGVTNSDSAADLLRAYTPASTISELWFVGCGRE